MHTYMHVQSCCVAAIEHRGTARHDATVTADTHARDVHPRHIYQKPAVHPNGRFRTATLMF